MKLKRPKTTPRRSLTVTAVDQSTYSPDKCCPLVLGKCAKGPVTMPTVVVAETPEDVDAAMQVPKGTTRLMIDAISGLCDRLGVPPKRRRRRQFNNKPKN